ncbi:MAG: hypothetical protein Q7K25_00300 [Actinomycetota bacterium]|nr:hypothetical protein [Actinomycetota bacterium]
MASELFFAFAVVLVQWLTGAYFWQLVRRGSAHLIEVLGLGLAIGTAAGALSGVLLWQWLPLWGWALPSVLAVVVAFILQWRTGSTLGPSGAQATTEISSRWFAIDRPSAVALIVSLGLGFIALAASLRSYPLNWSGTLTSYHPDMLFFEALSTSLAQFGPSESIFSNNIFAAGNELRYHWLTYAWSGQITHVVEAQPFLVLTRVLPVTALIGAVLIAVAWTRRLTTMRWAPTIAALLIVTGGYVGATYGTILNFDSPSQQLATVWVLGLCLALWQVTSSKTATRFPLLLLVILVLAAAATLGKVSAGVVALAAWGFVAVVGAMRRESWAARAWAALAAAGVGVAGVYFAYIAGSAEGGGLGLGSLLNKASSVQGLNPTDAKWGILFGTGLLLLAMAARWIGLVWLVGSRSTRWQPVTIFGMGLVVASVASVLLISGGLNDTWFALAASAPLAIISALGIAHALLAIAPRMRWVPTWPIVAAIAVGVIASVLIAAVWTFGPGHSPFLRWAGPLVAYLVAFAIALVIAAIWRSQSGSRFLRCAVALTLVTLTVMAAGARVLGVSSTSFGLQSEGGMKTSEFVPLTPFIIAKDLVPVTSWTDNERAAGQYLADHAHDADIVATNSTYSPLVAALGQQRTLISGIQYQAPYGRPSALQSIMDRESISLEFANNPGVQTAANLCNSGVTWFWIDPRRTATRNWLPYATIEFNSPDAIVLKFDQSAC